MYGVYEPLADTKKLIKGDFDSIGAAQDYVTSCRVMTDTTEWLILPVEIMEA